MCVCVCLRGVGDRFLESKPHVNKRGEGVGESIADQSQISWSKYARKEISHRNSWTTRRGKKKKKQREGMSGWRFLMFHFLCVWLNGLDMGFLLLLFFWRAWVTDLIMVMFIFVSKLAFSFRFPVKSNVELKADDPCGNVEQTLPS